MLRVLVAVALLAPAVRCADLAAIRNEPRLERRSELALEHAIATVERARDAWRASKMAEFQQALEEIREASELSYQSLRETGKPARRHPKYFKRAEKNLRSLMKKLDGLFQEVGIDDRAAVDEVRRRASDLHDQVVTDIMSKKK
ncbi:MAG TPA: hypothetical protein VFL57_06055 [Bryobacteraceae bacterium]|nr:hypothetical protein [Bryobacteraceae bacterium]